MSEEMKNVELKEDELKNVSGGGSGTIPKNGIEFSTYYWIDDGCYYSQQQSADEVAYVYRGADGSFYYTIESIVCTGNTWQSTSKFRARSMDSESEFRSKYPYILNIRP